MALSRRELSKKEVDDNYEFFIKNLAKIKKENPKKSFALLKNKKLIGCFDSLDNAEKASQLKFKGELYSIQEINPSSINLGYQSYVLF